jgi:hypothetical protein
MSENHLGGNIQNAILVEEHQGNMNAKRVVGIESAPTDSTKLNASTTYSYDGDGNLQYKNMIVGAVTYRKTYTYTGGVLTAKSAYVAI